MSIDVRFEYLRAMQVLYRKADVTEKIRMLNEMQQVTGQTRKHLTYQMGRPDLYRRRRSRERERTYGDDVVAAITVIAGAHDWICARRLLPTLLRTARDMIVWQELQVESDVLAKLGKISLSTLGRILPEIRPKESLPRAYPGRPAETKAQQAVPETIIPWHETEPGHFEVDLVHHGVPDEDGHLICTIQFIDVLTGWSERLGIMGYTFDTVWQAVMAFKSRCPISVREFHTDNGSEFINMALITAFGQEMVDAQQTRGRPHHSNDNRFVEQKNSSLVRAYFGYAQLNTYQQLEMLNHLYADMWLYYNFFQPVLRQVARTAVKGEDHIVRIHRRQDCAKTPLDRLIEAKPPISKEIRTRLLALREETNLAALNRKIHGQLDALLDSAKAD